MRWSVVLLAACSFEHGRLPPMVGVDAPGNDVPLIDMDAPLGAWSTPVEITELTGFSEDDPSLTDDLLEIYFGSRRTPTVGGEDIWMASRSSPTGAWKSPVSVSELNSGDTETTIRVTRDGLAIFFTRSIQGNADIFFSTRGSRMDAWSTPQPISELNLTNDQEYAPFASTNLLRIIFCRGNSVANEALWVATRATNTAIWEAPNVILELNESAVSECDPIEIGDRVVYYSSNRAGRYDIYRSERANAVDPYGPRVLVDGVNTSSFTDRDPWVSSDERYMVFASDRVGGDFRLYLSTR